MVFEIFEKNEIFLASCIFENKSFQTYEVLVLNFVRIHPLKSFSILKIYIEEKNLDVSIYFYSQIT